MQLSAKSKTLILQTSLKIIVYKSVLSMIFLWHWYLLHYRGLYQSLFLASTLLLGAKNSDSDQYTPLVS